MFKYENLRPVHLRPVTMLTVSELASHSQLMATFQSNYQHIKQMKNSISCKSTEQCGIVNAFRVSELLSGYCAKILQSKRNMEGEDARKMNPVFHTLFMTQKSSTNDDDSTPTVPAVNSNLENQSDNALSNLFADELENTNGDENLERETLCHLSVVGDNFGEPGCSQKATEVTNDDGLGFRTMKNDTQEQYLDGRPHRCTKCRMAFKRKLHLNRHFIVTHTRNKNFSCDTCGKQFSRKDYLDKHIGGHQKKNFKLKLLQQGIVIRTKMHLKTERNDTD